MAAPAIAAQLAQAGATHAFGVPGGGANLDLIGELEAAGLRFVLTHTETAAAIMAGTAAEVTGVPAACLATRGPGAASMANGVAQAWLDRCPILAVTDAITAADRPRIGHQRIAHNRVYATCAKASAEVGDRNAAEVAAAALASACTPPWGPVHLDMVADTGRAARFPPAPQPSSPDHVRRARRLLEAARQPLVVCGVGCRHAEVAVAELVRALGVPALTTYKAKGAVPESGEHAAGLFTGATIEGAALEAADLIVMVGVDPVELIPAGWPYPAPIVSISPWPLTDTYFPVEAEVVGDVEQLLAELGRGTGPRPWPVSGRRLRAEALAAIGWHGGGMSPHDVVATVRSACPPGTIATVDAGAHMLVAMPLWETDEPRSVLISSGLATMGFALPAAIAASLVRPDRRVACFTGDAGLGMCLAELETLARLQLPVTVVVLNDSELSLIRIKQRVEGHGGPGAVAYRGCDFSLVARGLGVAAQRVETVDRLRAAVAAAGGAPLLVDAVIDPASYPHVLAATRG